MTTTQRQRTQWTGNIKVPSSETEMVEPSGSRSKLPLILGAIVVLGAGGAAAFFATRGGDSTEQGSNTPSGSDVGSQGSQIATNPGSATLQPDAAVTPPPPDLPPLPDRVKIKLGSNPKGAEVKDLAKNRPLGKTPVTLDVKGSRDPISLSITMRGYSDLIIDLTPDKSFDYVVPLEKGESGTTPTRKVVGAGSAATKPPDGPTTKIDTGSATPQVKPPEGSAKPPEGSAKPPEKPPEGSAKPPPEEDCPPDEMPCLKKFP